MSLVPTPPAVPRRILEDASGHRLRLLRRVGRAVALVLVVWLGLVFLGGIGVGPAAHVPFGNLLRPSLAPPPLRHAPRVVPAAPADLVPALPAPAAVKGKSASAPGRSVTTTTHGKSATAPGHTSTNTRSKKPAAPPGRTKTTTTTGKKP